jgi:hypothetical protein
MTAEAGSDVPWPCHDVGEQLDFFYDQRVYVLFEKDARPQVERLIEQCWSEWVLEASRGRTWL